MNHIRRFSSRRQRLVHAFLSVRLKEAKSSKRIAGYLPPSSACFTITLLKQLGLTEQEI